MNSPHPASEGWLHVLPVGVLVVDLRDRVVFMNAACAGLLEVAASKARGRPLDRLVGESAWVTLAGLIASARGGRPARGEVQIRGDTSRGTQVDFAAAPAADGTQNVVATLAATPAGTTRGDGSVDAGHAYPGARARERFLALVSHELRSPLNAIQSWSYVLDNQLHVAGAGEPAARRALAGIRSGIAQQIALIDQLVDASIALTGTLPLSRVSVVVRESIERALADVRDEATAKDVAVHVDMRLHDECIDGDLERIRQVFFSLLTNALRCTPHGGDIWLTARHEAGEATIVVRDDGPGLDPGHEAWLFEPFMPLDDPDTPRASGIALGLALASRIVAAHDGRIEGQSGGKYPGTTFTVSLPLAARDAESAGSQTAAP